MKNIKNELESLKTLLNIFKPDEADKITMEDFVVLTTFDVNRVYSKNQAYVAVSSRAKEAMGHYREGELVSPSPIINRIPGTIDGKELYSVGVLCLVFEDIPKDVTVLSEEGFYKLDAIPEKNFLRVMNLSDARIRSIKCLSPDTLCHKEVDLSYDKYPLPGPEF